MSPKPKAPSGVAFTAPPTHLISDARRIIEAASAQLPPGARGGIIGLVSDTGVNAAVVNKIGNRFAVGAWIGKESGWGTRLTGGAVVQASW